MVIYTIGFAKKNLRQFIGLLQEAGVRKVIDIRLNNTSQLAGYSKKDDLAYILELVGMEYQHMLELAPTKELLDSYKKNNITWTEYEKIFNELMLSRNAEKLVNVITDVSPVCLLCAEEKPARCHRRLVAEFFARYIADTEVRHL